MMKSSLANKIGKKAPSLSAAKQKQKTGVRELAQSEKCLGKYVLTWPFNYGAARHKLSSHFFL